MASAYSRTSFSDSENSSLARYFGNAAILSVETPLVLLTAEPISIQNAQPTSVATRSWARFFSPASISLLEKSDCSIWP